MSSRLVTIGSPLGLQEVQDFLDVPAASQAVPRAGLRHALGQLRRSARPGGARQGAGLRVRRDVRLALPSPIVDHSSSTAARGALRGFNPHSAVGYLSHPKVRRSVYEARALRLDGAVRGRARRRRDAGPRCSPSGADRGARTGIRRGGRERLPNKATRETARVRCWPRASIAPPTGPETAGHDSGQAVGRIAGRREAASKDARIDRLRRFVAAHLNPEELRLVAQQHRHFNVYAVWRSAAKSKLLDRSRARPAGRRGAESYHAAGTRIRWAVLDTGVRSDHPHFGPGPDARDRAIGIAPSPAPQAAGDGRRQDGHGSHVAGIIAGQRERRRQDVLRRRARSATSSSTRC